MAKQRNDKQHKTNPFLWFLFAIVIPLIVAAVLTAIIFSAAGVNVLDWAKNTGRSIPVISEFVSTGETNEQKNNENKVEKLKAKLADKDAEIEALHQDIRVMEDTIEQLEQEIIKLENSQETAASIDEAAHTENDTVKTMAKSFKEMDPEQAALIFGQLEPELAVSIM